MSAFGENLRREREMRGITLKEISDATKIGARMLEAIETERFERLPGGVFNRAFVRQYARYLGLDEEHAVTDFDAAFGAAAQAAESRKQSTVLPQAWVQRRVSEKEEEEERQRRRRWPMWIALGLVTVTALAIGGFRVLKSSPGASTSGAWTGREAQPPLPLKNMIPPPKDELIQKEAPSTPAGDADIGASAGPLKLQLDASERVAFTVVQDGRRPWNAVLRAGDRRIIQAAATLQLEVSNARGVTVTLNGQNQGTLGERNDRKIVTYTLNDLKATRSGGVRP